MKINSKKILGIALAGLVAGATLPALAFAGDDTAANDTEKSGCKGNNGCSGEEAGDKDSCKSKDSCEAKDSCGGKNGCNS